tara:strand:+ start:484 stop:705 length:222 start_codon:yes stop_codon:yes gene_type:complete
MTVNNGTILLVKTYLRVASIVFFCVAATHILRVATDSNLIIGSWIVPDWVSVLAAIVSMLLSVIGLRYAQKVD